MQATADSLCCTAEKDTVLWRFYTPVKSKKRKRKEGREGKREGGKEGRGGGREGKGKDGGWEERKEGESHFTSKRLNFTICKMGILSPTSGLL